MIEEKAIELQQQLEEWVKENALLQVGERLAFSLQIEGIPLVVHDRNASYWDMKPDEFFSVDRVVSFGLSHSNATRIHRVMHYLMAPYYDPPAPFNTMRDFITYCNVRRLLNEPNMGPKNLREIIRILEQSGFPVDNPKWYIKKK